MSSDSVTKLKQPVTVLEGRIEESDYLDYLDFKDSLAQSHYEEEQLGLFRRERRDGTSIEWHEAFEDKLEETAQLKSFVLELYAGRTQPPFDVKEVLVQWPNLEPTVRSALAWLAGQCSRFRQSAERPGSDTLYHQVTQEEAPSSANLGS